MDAMYAALLGHADQSVAGLLPVFRCARRPMAVVRDDGPKFLGIVMVEDILGEILGEIVDENDVPA